MRYEIRIWNQDNPDIEVAAGEIGEIGGRGGCLMLGYFDNQGATEQSFNAHGWFLSGDLGMLDAKGCLPIIGRKKDLIIRGGHNIHPATIEDLAVAHPAVLKAAAFPIADERLGEKVCLAVIASQGAPAARGDAAASVRRRPVQVRHARVLHRPRRVPADSERQDPEARAGRMGEAGAHRAGAGALERFRQPINQAGELIMPITLSRREEFAVITIDRQEALNALSFSLIGELEACLDQVAQSDARALLITGAGPKAFCAGADITELMGQAPEAHKRGVEFGQARVFDAERVADAVGRDHQRLRLRRRPRTCACLHFRLATANAKVGLPEIKLGLIPGYGGTQRLPRLIGEARALELILTGRTVEADEALQLGLVNRMVEGDPLEAGIAYAREFTCHSLPSLRCAREAVQRALQTTLAEGLKIEADLSTLAYQTADAVEGMTAFLEKRKPNFNDR